ncbi:Adenosine deaminase-like protein [Schistosoma japonicum]|nr:Adenosine deaminase-like protein [Schistosoma japonicum]
MNSFYYDLPKVELHAHLSGSISTEFLKRESIAHHGLQYTDPRFGFESWEGDLDRCFDYFQKIHKYIDTPEILQRLTSFVGFFSRESMKPVAQIWRFLGICISGKYHANQMIISYKNSSFDENNRATASVIEEFCQENVILLELRTTLRPLPTHRSYLNSVIKGIQGSPSVLDNRIYVTLLLSLDRSKSVDEALITLELAKEYYSSGLISGIDLSGNPLAGNLCDFVPLLNTARSYGFKTTVHIAEVTNQSEDWWHGTFLTDLDENAVLARGITDDKGLFNCTLSGELQLSAERCGLSKQQHFQILVDSVNMSFFSEDVKYHSLQKIKEYFNKFIIDHSDKI